MHIKSVRRTRKQGSFNGLSTMKWGKTFHTVEEAPADITDGSTIGIGGFFAAGVPRTLIRGLIRKSTKDLTICCGSGFLLGAYRELDRLVARNRIGKLVDSYGLFRSATKRSTHPFEQKIVSGEIEFEVTPKGLLLEEVYSGLTPEDIRSVTEPELIISPDLKEIEL